MTLKEFRSVSAGEKNGPEIFADLYFAEVTLSLMQFLFILYPNTARK